MNQTASIAASIPPEHRKNLALIVLAKNEPITDLAAREKVSRRFLYRQKSKATNALNQAFSPISSNQDVLFYLPVTKTWLKQLILALILICHSSYRGVKELLRDLFDTPISIASIHNLVHSTALKAKQINDLQDLSECPARVGKSPTELLTGEPHPHWLELLGFERFQRSAIVA